MTPSRLNFRVEAEAPGSRARAATFRTLHNEVLTPLFMPVGTQATVKAQLPQMREFLALKRQHDPGELFPWKRLAQEGHGLWAESDPAPGAPLALGDKGLGVFGLQAGFTRLGYDLPPSGACSTTSTRPPP